MVSSNTQLVGREPGHLLIDPATEDGKTSGLRFPSAVNVHAIHTIHTDRIERIAGRLSSELKEQVLSAFSKTFESE